MWRRQFTAEPEPEVPLYIIGDIHGRCDLLIRLIAMIDADAQSRHLRNHVLVFVGDYVDRGPQSALVLSLMLKLMSEPSRNVVALKGNHEALLLQFLGNPAMGQRWLKNGGFETLISYGISNVTEDTDLDRLAWASRQLREMMGEDTIGFLNRLELSYRSGNIFVSHAGADPKRDLDGQDEKTLVWGPVEFRKRIRKDKIWVAHGHYADPVPRAEDGRISVDTGAYFSDQLTAARILKKEIKFLTAEI